LFSYPLRTQKHNVWTERINLDAFAKLQKATYGLVMAVCPSA